MSKSVATLYYFVNLTISCTLKGLNCFLLESVATLKSLPESSYVYVYKHADFGKNLLFDIIS